MNFIDRCQNERGAALVISLMFLAILGLLGSTAVVLTTTDMRIGGNYKANATAFYDADAGGVYAIAKMEEGLKAYPQTFVHSDGDSLRDMDIGETISLAAFTAPSGFNFTYEPPGLTKIADKLFSFTTNGAGLNNSKTIIATTCKTVPVIDFGVFGDKKVDLGNTAGVYSYSHSATPNPTTGGSTDEGDVGSNESVILRNSSVVNGDVALGENPAGSDGVLTDLGGIVSGENGMDIVRVDPDPLGIVGGEYAANFATYSTCSISTALPPSANTNDNCCYDTNPSLPSHCYLVDPYDVSSPTPLVYDPDSEFDTSGNEINVGNNKELTLKGKEGGANYYVNDIILKNNATLYIDTTNGPVNIYLTGEINAITGSNFVNTTDTTCSGGSCTCAPSSCTIGAPSNFSIFASSQSNTDTISIGNDVTFSGLIYAPYITVRMDNSADIYGAIIAREVEIVNSVNIFFDTDMSDDYDPRALAFTTWRDVRD